jgi:hypothetical protein
MSSRPPSPAARCAAHPSRPAVDSCPRCERPRCDADRALGPGGGCVVCRGADPAPTPARSGRVARNRELLVRAALAADAAAVAWGYVTAEYVGADVFQYLSPAVLGVLCGGAATTAAGSPGPGVLSNRIRLVAVLFALLGTALGFVLEGTYRALTASTDVLVPYAIAAGAAWLWTTPPRRRKAD